MSTMSRPSRRAVLKTSGAAALMSAAPVPALANTAPQRAHHAATKVVLQFEVAPAEAGSAAAPRTTLAPLSRPQSQ